VWKTIIKLPILTVNTDPAVQKTPLFNGRMYGCRKIQIGFLTREDNSLNTSEAVPPLFQYIFMVWFLIKRKVRLHGVVISPSQGQPHLYVLLIDYLVT